MGAIQKNFGGPKKTGEAIPNVTTGKSILVYGLMAVAVLAIVFVILGRNKAVDEPTNTTVWVRNTGETNDISNTEIEGTNEVESGTVSSFEGEPGTTVAYIYSESVAEPVGTIPGEPFATECTNLAPEYLSAETILNTAPVDSDGNRLVYPIRHDNYEKIPLVGADVFENTMNTHYQGMEDQSSIRVLEISTQTTYIVRLIGITGYGDPEYMPTAWGREEQFLSSFFSNEEGHGPSLVIENMGTNPDGSINGYAWYQEEYALGSERYRSLNERLLIEGWCEPMLSTSLSKYNNWFIQYPNLYRPEVVNVVVETEG